MSGDRSAPCGCGKDIPLTRSRLDFPGAWVTCPACGIELTVWQWVARANRRETHETNARNTHQAGSA